MSTLTQVSVQQLHIENLLWKNELTFYKEELKLLEKYLLEVAGKQREPESSVGVEHFQNQIYRHQEVLHELKHDIKRHENNLDILATSDQGDMYTTESGEHDNYRDRVETFRKLYAEMKSEYMQFLGKWL
jgi:hypothetical protein